MFVIARSLPMIVDPLVFGNQPSLCRWLRWGRFYFLLVYVWPKIVFTALLTCLAAPSLFEPPALPLDSAKESSTSKASPGSTRPFAYGVLVLAIYLLLAELFELRLMLRAHMRTHKAQREGHWVFGMNILHSGIDRYAWMGATAILAALGAAINLLGAADVAEEEQRRASEVICVLLAVATTCSWMYTVFEMLVSVETVGIFAVLVGEST